MKFVLQIVLILFLFSPQGGNHRLIITFRGLQPIKGDLYLALHSRPEYFEIADSAFIKKIVLVTAETETISFNNIPDGHYALAVYHDENLNGVLDVNDIGIPKEGYGFSRDARSKFGPPSFDRAAVAIEPGENKTLTVNVKG